MTKMKTRKMTKSTFAIVIMGIAMVAMLAFGGTFAYFTASTQAGTRTATTGIIQLGTNSVGTFNANVVSGEQVFGALQKVTVKNQSNRDSYIFVTFTVTLTDENGQDLSSGLVNLSGAQTDAAREALLTTEGQFGLVYEMYHDENTTWNALTGVQTKAVADNPDTTEVDESKAAAAVTGVFYLDAAPVVDNPETTGEGNDERANGVLYTVCDSIKFYGYSNSNESDYGSLMNASITVTVTSRAIQKSGTPSVQEAYLALVGNTSYELTPAQQGNG